MSPPAPQPAKRIEILIEAPLLKRLAGALTKAGATGWTALPVLAGDGRSGEWSREGQVGAAGGLVAVTCVVAPDRAEPVIEAAFGVVSRHIGLVTVVDCVVLRPGRF